MFTRQSFNRHTSVSDNRYISNTAKIIGTHQLLSKVRNRSGTMNIAKSKHPKNGHRLNSAKIGTHQVLHVNRQISNSL